MIFPGIFNKDNKKVEVKRHTLSVNEWPEYVVILDEKNFDDFIKKYPLSLMDFWAPWCSPCRAMIPRLRRLSKIYKGRVAFGRLDTQKNQSLPKKYVTRLFQPTYTHSTTINSALGITIIIYMIIWR